ncbi:MAG TPA: antibiotic biosynthesis monooxygenase [Paenibacillus sp.]|uniref:putative quinol monooxygenase n=1 Tax=Paenibacillus TaxID=44249 RepID=UPI000BA152A2|nr:MULTISPECIES: putative quinol monooxygenase [Paenibacillus]OZQ73035.1 antibiotic biosynthesis monooxygenase [Paenibacillus taichungensis]HBU81098.1 antibiotic biosynthesis monooxygenase [Paenibacillus sp.]
MIIIHAHLQVKPDQEQAFLEATKVLISATRNEEGNISYDLAKSTELEHHYTMVELWKDEAATASHNASSHFQAFVQQAAAFMAAPMNVEIFAGEAVKH